MKLTLDTWRQGMTDELPVRMEVEVVIGCPESGGVLVSSLGRNLMVMGLDLRPGEVPTLDKLPRVVSIIRLTPEEGRELVQVLDKAVKAMLDD